MDPKCTPPDIMVCYRVRKDGPNSPTLTGPGANPVANQLANGLNNLQTINAATYDLPGASVNVRQRVGSEGIALKQSKSRELRGGIMYTGCDCEKKNGLQDDCLRSECRGSPQCLTRPNPTCGPSEFSNGKHLEKKRLYMEQVRRNAQHNVPGQAQAQEPNVANLNPYAQLYTDTYNDGNNANQAGQGQGRFGTTAPGVYHPEDCCCCYCCTDAEYHCVEGVEMGQEPPPPSQGAAIKCPGTALCGPGICPVGECPGGVCANGQRYQKQNIESIIPGGDGISPDNNKTACYCDGRGRNY